jgi:hypothetical protein
VDISYAAGSAAAPKLDIDFTGVQAGDTMLTVAPTATVDFANKSLADVAVFEESSLHALDTLLQVGDTVQIIDGAADMTAEGFVDAIGLDGFAYEVDENGTLKLAGKSGSDSYKPYFEGAAAAVLTVTEAARGLEATVDGLSAEAAADQFLIKVGFVGESVENETGSSVDLNQYGYSLAGGRKVETGAGAITFGAFLEGGSGSYETVNSLAIVGEIRGDGDTDYFGGGLFLRHDFTGGSWASLSGRIGSVENDYKVKDLVVQGQNIAYTSDSDYYGFNVAFGHLFEVSESTGIDLYGKFSYTSVKGDSVKDKRDGELSFDDATSARTRIGGRLNHAFSENLSLFFGLAWEQEFDGKTGGTYRDPVTGETYSPSNPDLGGASAFGEIGIKVKAGDYFAFQLEAFGLAGQSKGGGGLASLVFTF